MNGATSDWLARAMTSLPTKTPRVLLYFAKASKLAAKALYWLSVQTAPSFWRVSQSVHARGVEYFVFTYWVDISWEIIKIYQEIDSRVGKGGHTSIMVGFGIDVIDTNGIGAQCLHESCIAYALCRVHQRVVWDQLVCNAWNKKLASDEGHGKDMIIPLMKNWFPSGS